MHLHLLGIIAGLILLVLGANLFVGGAASLARHFGISTLLIGMVVVGFGTSAPEMLVSATASYRGTSGVALGNAFGSNTVNILLILGISALLRPLKVTREVISRDLPVLLAVTGIALAVLWDGEISRFDACILLVAFAAFLFITVRRQPKPDETGQPHNNHTAKQHKDSRPAAAIITLLVGLGLMLISSEMLVRGSVAVAQHLGISDLVIGLTIVAIGTSLPELASSVVAARKGEDEMALGNILGSNIFNTLMVVGIAGLIRPLSAEPELLNRDLPVMTAATILLYLFCRSRRGDGDINRLEGGAMLAMYIIYTAYLVFTATSGA